MVIKTITLALFCAKIKFRKKWTQRSSMGSNSRLTTFSADQSRLGYQNRYPKVGLEKSMFEEVILPSRKLVKNGSYLLR